MTEIICTFLSWFQTFIVDHLPIFSLDSGTLGLVSNGFETMISFISQVNFFVPLPTILVILSIVYGIKISKFALFLINWLIRRFADFFP